MTGRSRCVLIGVHRPEGHKQENKPNMVAAVKEPTNSTEAKAAEAKARKDAKADADAEKAKARQAVADAKAAEKARIAALPKRKCLCGCGTDVNGKSNFLPGHDARLVGKVARGEADAGLLTPFPALAAKAAKMKAGLDEKAAGAGEREAAKAAKAAEKAVTDAAKEAQRTADRAAKAAAKASKPVAAVAGTQDADVEIKIGKDWVPGSKVSEADGKVTVRHMNAKREWTNTSTAAKNVRSIQDL